MKFSAQEEYGLRCLLQIAEATKAGHEPTIPELSEREGLGSQHVAKMLTLLKNGGFVVATRGQTGGYRLARNPNEISISEVLECLGGKLFDDSFCERHAGKLTNCAHSTECAIRNLWQSMQQAIDSVMVGMTLGDLMRQSAVPIQLSERPRRTDNVGTA